jgi:hypothetical protein
VKLHPDEIALARAYEHAEAFEGLTEAQSHAIMTRGRELFHWYKAHKPLHMHTPLRSRVGVCSVCVHCAVD